MPRRFGAESDLDRDVILLLYRQIESQVDTLVESKLQHRQQWGPTFKQEDVAELAMPDADFVVPPPEYGKRTLVLTGTLSATRIVRISSIPTAWWFVINNTNQSLQFLIDPSGTVGPLVGPRQSATIITPDGVVINRATGNVEELVGVKMLTDTFRTPLFKIQYANSDQKAAAGRVELFMVAKGPVQIASYIKTVYFVSEHHPSGLGNARWGEVLLGAPPAPVLGDMVSSFGGVTWTFSVNTTNYPTYAAPVSDAFTFELTATSGSMGSPVDILLQYTVFPLGEVATILV